MSDDQTFTARDAAALIGISQERLRALAPCVPLSRQRQPGGWRRYSLDDIHKLALVETVCLCGLEPPAAVDFLRRNREAKEFLHRPREEIQFRADLEAVRNGVEFRLNELPARVLAAAVPAGISHPRAAGGAVAHSGKAGSTDFQPSSGDDATPDEA